MTIAHFFAFVSAENLYHTRGLNCSQSELSSISLCTPAVFSPHSCAQCQTSFETRQGQQGPG